MGLSCRKNGILNIGKEIRCPESGGGKGKRKTIMRCDASVKRDLGRMGGGWRTIAKNSRGWKLYIVKVMREM